MCTSTIPGGGVGTGTSMDPLLDELSLLCCSIKNLCFLDISYADATMLDTETAMVSTKLTALLTHSVDRRR